MNDEVNKQPEENAAVVEPETQTTGSPSAKDTPAETSASPAVDTPATTTTSEENKPSFEDAPQSPKGPSGLSSFLSGAGDLFAKNKVGAITALVGAVIGSFITGGFGAVLLGSLGLLLGGALGDKGGNIRQAFNWIGDKVGIKFGNDNSAGQGQHQESTVTRGTRKVRDTVKNLVTGGPGAVASAHDGLSNVMTDVAMGLNPNREAGDARPATMGEQVVGEGASALLFTGGGATAGAGIGAGTIIGATALSDAGLGIIGTGATYVGATATVATAATVGAVVVAAAGTGYLAYKAGSITNDTRKLYDYIDNAFTPDMERYGNAVGAYTRLHNSLGKYGGKAIEYVDDYGETRRKYDLLLPENQKALQEAIIHKKAEIREEMSNTYTGGWITKYVNYGSGEGRQKYETLKMDLRMLTSAEEELPHFLHNKEEQARQAYREAVAQQEAERAAQQAVANTKNVSGAQDTTEASVQSTPAVAKTDGQKKDGAVALDDKGIPVAQASGNDLGAP